MKKDSMVGYGDSFVKIGICLFLLSSLFIFSDSLTGLAPLGRSNSKEAVISLFPSEDVIGQESNIFYAGTFVHIRLETGDKGTNSMYSIWDPKGNRIDQRRVQTCSDTACRGNQVYTSKYQIGKDWVGDYYIRMVERQTYKEIEARLTVISRG